VLFVNFKHLLEHKTSLD